jgi:hypothetical protein
MRQLAQAGLQNDKINFSGLMDIYLSESMSSMRRKIEQYEEEAMQRIEATEQANRESAERIQEMVVQNDQAEREQRYQEKILDSETKITVANINAASGAESGQQSAYNSEDAKLTLEKLKQDWKKFESELKLKKEQLNETIRHNKKTEVISSKKAIQRKK